MEVSHSQLVSLVHDAPDNALFSVCFIKRGDGQERTMLCRKNVSAFVEGKGLAFNPNDYNLLPVFDMEAYNALISESPTADRGAIGKKCYRNINLETIRWVKIGGETYTLKGAKRKFRIEFRESGDKKFIRSKAKVESHVVEAVSASDALAVFAQKTGRKAPRKSVVTPV